MRPQSAQRRYGEESAELLGRLLLGASAQPVHIPFLPCRTDALWHDHEYGDEEGFLDGETRQHRTVKLLVSGGIAGVISRSATAPLDRLKMLLQVNDAERRMTMKEGLRVMAKEGTVKSFFKGNGTNVLKIAPGTALFSVCFVVDDPGSTRGYVLTRTYADANMCEPQDIVHFISHTRLARRNGHQAHDE